MPSPTSPLNSLPTGPVSRPLSAPTAQSRSQSASKRAETVRRHKAEKRVDKLGEMRAQIDDGTLIVRQMTVAEHTEASQDALAVRTRIQRQRA